MPVIINDAVPHLDAHEFNLNWKKWMGIECLLYVAFCTPFLVNSPTQNECKQLLNVVPNLTIFIL